MFTLIVVANDGSEGGFRALGMACDLANRYSAALHMISVEELPNFPASIDEIVEIKEDENHKFHDVLERGRAMAKAKGIDLNAEVVAGHARDRSKAHARVLFEGISVRMAARRRFCDRDEALCSQKPRTDRR